MALEMPGHLAKPFIRLMGRHEALKGSMRASSYKACKGGLALMNLSRAEAIERLHGGPDTLEGP